jgi:hypothetical protein
VNSRRGLEGASAELGQLAARLSRLESRLIALERAKLQARRDVERAQRSHVSPGANPTRAASVSVARRLEAAQRTLESVERERDEIVAELPDLRLARHEVIRRAASPAWAELQRHRAEEYAAGMALAAQVEALVVPYAQIVAETALAKSELDTLLATLGQDAQHIRKDLASEMSETAVPDTPEDRQALRRAYQIRNVFSQELSYRW